MNRKTKILATLGPSSEEEEIIEEMAKYANGFRINFSHARYKEVEEKVKIIREVEEKLGKRIAIVGDTKGREIRTGNKEEIKVKEGEILKIEKLKPSYEIERDLEVGDVVLVNDGKIKFIYTGEGKLKALNSGVIIEKRKINLPGKRIQLSFLSEKDREDILFMKKHDFDFIALSFVNEKEEIKEVKEMINNEEIKLIAKIESSLGVKNAEGIIEESDGVMVARGDLGVEVEIEELPHIQAELVKKAREKGKISIIATHLLASMTTQKVPTRAEITDVANAVMQRADAVMLSEETSTGEHPVETLKTMDKIIRKAEERLEEESAEGVEPSCYKEKVAKAAIVLSREIDGEIIAPTMHGTTPSKLSKFRPKRRIIAISPRKKAGRHLALTYACEFFEMQYEPVMERIDEIKEKLSIDKKAVFVFGYPPGNHNTNVILVK